MVIQTPRVGHQAITRGHEHRVQLRVVSSGLVLVRHGCGLVASVGGHRHGEHHTGDTSHARGTSVGGTATGVPHRRRRGLRRWPAACRRHSLVRVGRRSCALVAARVAPPALDAVCGYAAVQPPLAHVPATTRDPLRCDGGTTRVCGRLTAGGCPDSVSAVAEPAGVVRVVGCCDVGGHVARARPWERQPRPISEPGLFTQGGPRFCAPQNRLWAFPGQTFRFPGTV